MISLTAVMEHALINSSFVMVKMIVEIILMSREIAVSFFYPMNYCFTAASLALLPCEGSSIRCNNTGACLPFWKGCNGVDDCGDKTDETNCKAGYLNIVRLTTQIMLTDYFSLVFVC